MCSTPLSQTIKPLINNNKSCFENKSLKSSVSFDSIKTEINSEERNDLKSDKTICASNIFDPNFVSEICKNKTTNDIKLEQNEWETVQTLNRSSIKSKPKVTELQNQKKSNTTSNPLTYLKSALFSQKTLQFKLKSQTSSSSVKRTLTQSQSLIICNNNNNKEREQNCLCNGQNANLNINLSHNKTDSGINQLPNVLFKYRSDESLNSNPNSSICSECVSNCSVCNDILNNCIICQQLSKYYAKSLKLKSNELYGKQLIQNAINQISLAKCNCLSCLSNSGNSSINSRNKASNSGIS